MLYLNENNNKKTEYKFGINDNKEKYIRKINKETKKEINIIFNLEDNTDIMTDVMNELSKDYIEETMKNV